jgi:hypothetical protein
MIDARILGAKYIENNELNAIGKAWVFIFTFSEFLLDSVNPDYVSFGTPIAKFMVKRKVMSDGKRNI